MISPEQIQCLIEELGPATEEVDEVQQEDETAWHIFFADETVVVLDFVADQEKLVLSTGLGAPPADRRAATYELLLIYNYNWQDSGGIKMALEPEAPGPSEGETQGEIVMLFELNANALDLPGLQQVLTNFRAIANPWRDLVAVGFGGEAAADVPTPDLPDAIKV